jgi:hypothetical protein
MVTVEATDENSIGECAAAIATREPLREGPTQKKGAALAQTAKTTPE